MIGKTDIERTLRGLQHRYQLAKTQKEPLWYSKLAIIELCGWIEVSTDDLVNQLARTAVKKHENLKWFQKEIVNKNYGFQYEKHFRNMLMAAVGLEGVEAIESLVSAESKKRLESEFEALTKSRNKLAHTYVKGVAAAIDAPSVTIARLEKIYPALIDYQSAVRTY